MARKKIDYIVSEENSRDNGKKYVIEEMSAVSAEKLCYRIIGAMLNAGVNLPPDFMLMPASAITFLCVTNFLRIDFEYLEPLLEEMMQCVYFVPDQNNPKSIRKISQQFNDIEEVSTLINLRIEVYKLHMDFFQAVIAPILSQYLESQTVEKVSQ
jgi:hypothetical protein